jgi:hypothetical protein
VAFQAAAFLRATALSGFRPRSPLRDSAGFSPDFPAPIRSRLVALKAVSIIAVTETECKVQRECFPTIVKGFWQNKEGGRKSEVMANEAMGVGFCHFDAVAGNGFGSIDERWF